MPPVFTRNTLRIKLACPYLDWLAVNEEILALLAAERDFCPFRAKRAYASTYTDRQRHSPFSSHGKILPQVASP
jgi:hypothetical protein